MLIDVSTKHSPSLPGKSCLKRAPSMLQSTTRFPFIARDRLNDGKRFVEVPSGTELRGMFHFEKYKQNVII